MKGDVARNTETWFLAPEGFEFVGISPEPWRQEPDMPEVGNWWTCKVLVGDMRQGVSQLRHVTIKTPEKTGEYTLSYRLYCDGFAGDRVEFSAVVNKE